MKRAMALLLALGAAAAAGCGSLDSPDRVHDLRLLAMRADPPDQVFALPFALDAGVELADGGVDPAVALALAQLRVDPVRVSALVADPAGGGRAIHYQFATCSSLVDDRCAPGDPNTFVLGSGDATADGGWVELSTTFTPRLSLIFATQQADPYKGFDFLPLPVQLSISAGAESTVGFKRVLFTFRFAGQDVPAPNQNPYIPELQLDGQPWDVSTPAVIADREEHVVAPLVVTAAEEPYSRPTFEGGSVQFRESWRYNFFATAGGYSAFGTGGQNNLTGGAAETESKWSPRNEDGPQRVTYFVVVRDGRGGEGWAVRTADFQAAIPR